MKTKFKLLPVFAGIILLFASLGCEKATDDECVKIYQNCMAQIKADKERAIQGCNNAGGAGSAECIAKVISESEKLEKACWDEFLKCRE